MHAAFCLESMLGIIVRCAGKETPSPKEEKHRWDIKLGDLEYIHVRRVAACTTDDNDQEGSNSDIWA